MREIIKKIRDQWLLAKADAEREYRSRGYNNVADAYRDCNLFRGDETLKGLCELMFTAQGREYIVERHFPTLAIFRMFRTCNLQDYGVYIDAGEIELINPRRVLLIGKTSATIRVDECSRHEITAIRGAKLALYMSGWGVASLAAEKGCQIIRNIKDNALIL